MNNKFSRIIIITFIATFLASSSEYLLGLESSFGLDHLFKFRGVRQPPKSITVITMDEKSEIDLNVGQDLTEWRQYHAKLINELYKQGAALIVFDLQFIKPNPDHDHTLANAMRQAKNILVTECTQKFLRGNEGFFGREECSERNKVPSVSLEGKVNTGLSDQLVIMRRIPPNPLLADAILDRAPFYLPKNPSNDQINEIWLYFDELAEIPSLPLLIWSYFLDYNKSIGSGSFPETDHADWLTQQRRICLQKPGNYVLDRILSSNIKHQLRTIICGSAIRYLNFYGPPKTFRMESYSDVYHGKVGDLKGKIILVGKAYRKYYYSNTDTYNTPFSSERLGKISGVEIIATQLANLLEDRWVIMPIPVNLGLLIFGLCITIFTVSINGFKRWGVVMFFVAGYIYGVAWAFSNKGIWLPIVTPVLIQLPLILFLDLMNRYHFKRLQKAAISRYIDKTVETYLLSPEAKHLGGKKLFCTVLFSDVRDFTTQTERHGAQATATMLNEYFSLMVNCIQQEKGVMDKFIGDAIMATFGIPKASSTDADRAVRSAIAMIEQLTKWNTIRFIHKKEPIKIGIGINSDEVIFGNIGSKNYMNLTVIGDGVNLAARLESACKQYSAQVLISEHTFKNLKGNYQIRELDIVVVKGKSEPIIVYEILDYHTQKSFPNLIEVLYLFQKGLDLYRLRRWNDAIECFSNGLKLNPNDYPCQMYIERCNFFLQTPPKENWKGIWVMTSK